MRRRVFFAKRRKLKKEEFLDTTENMLSRNSLPQICVVSVDESVPNQDIQQEYVRSGSLGNQYVYSLANHHEIGTATPRDRNSPSC
jgi:cell division protein FtsX